MMPYSCDRYQEIFRVHVPLQYHTVPDLLDSQTALSNSYPDTYFPSRESVYHFYMPVERQDVLWSGPVRPSTIACECDILKTVCLIGFIFWYWTLLIWVILKKNKMAAIAVWRLTLYPMQDIACERSRLKTAFRIDFTFWYGLNTIKTSDGIDLGHSTETKMAATAVWRLTLYPLQDIDTLLTSSECDPM